MTIKHTKKLNNKGASIVLSLVAFLVASLVCISIVNAALLNMSRSASEMEEQRAYLAVSSAAQALRECLGGANCVKEGDKAAVMTGRDGKEDTDYPKALEALGSLMDSDEFISSVPVEISVDPEKLPDVEGTLTLYKKDDYTLKADLKTVPGEEGGDISQITVYFRGTSITTNNDDGSKKLSVSWPVDGVYIVQSKSVGGE